MTSIRRRVLAYGLCGIALHGCGDGGGGSMSTAVVRSERIWFDSSRNLPRTPTREIRVLLWRPDVGNALPLLILAHGWGGLPEKFDAFAQTIAAAGYVVAAPAFPLTNENAPGGHERGFADVVNQPGDVSFVIDRLLEANDGPTDPLFSGLQPQRIAVLGHSLGGLTTLAATRKDCCRDRRIAAAILVAPLAGLFLDQFGSDPISEGPPTLFVHGLADTAIAFEGSVVLYGQVQPSKVLVGLADTGHSEALESQVTPAIPARRAAEAATVAFLNAVFRNRSTALEATLDELAAGGHRVERISPDP